MEQWVSCIRNRMQGTMAGSRFSTQLQDKKPSFHQLFFPHHLFVHTLARTHTLSYSFPQQPTSRIIMEAFKKKLDAARAEAETALAKAETIETELNEKKKEKEQKEQNASELQSRISALESELENAQTGGSDSKSKERELELRVEDLERQNRLLSAENAKKGKHLEDLDEKIAKLNSAFEDLGDL
ncbi:hypothetical protein B0O80DRAFT_486688 [Mortierella sp. GBAus27b]|nr:hypothetical protein B0O80DRAFT_486688 [Mortierella sp. GBAus27b]